METAKRRVTVIGAGFSGLVSAYYLERAGYKVDIIEKNSGPGGLIGSHREGFGLVETAANGLLNSARVEDLFSDLGLDLTPTLPDARRRLICVDGRARRWPIGFWSTLRLLRFALLRVFGAKSVRPRALETVQDWATRVLGQETAENLIAAFLQGIYAGDSRRMSASAVFGWLFQKLPRVRKPRHRGTVAPRAGMGALIQRLAEVLQSRGVEIRYGVEFDGRKPGHPLVVATSAARAREILSALDPHRAELLSRIELLPLVSAAVAFRFETPVRAFGCLMAPKEKRRVLGVLFNNCIFPDRGNTETWILGGASGGREMVQKSDDELLKVIHDERQIIFGERRSAVIGSRITRWPEALPHYTLELERALPELQGFRDGVILMGNYLGDIGLARILDRAARLPEEIKGPKDNLENLK